MIFPFKPHNSLFAKLLISLTIMLTVLILGLSLLLYQNYSSASLKLINRMDSSKLSQISYSANYMENISKRFLDSLILSPYTSILLYKKEDDMYLLGDAFRNLNNLTLLQDYVFSVYTINLTLDRITSTETSRFYNASDFYDQNIISLMKNMDMVSPSSMPIARTIPIGYNVNDESQHTNVYTYIVPYWNDSDKHPDKAVVVNIKASHLSNIITSLNAKSETSGNRITVIDSDGLIVSDTNKNLFSKNLLSTEYIKKVLDFQTPTGNFKTKIDNELYNVNFVSSENPNWKFISLTSYNSFMGPVNSIKFSTLIICIVVLLLGLLSSFIMSRSIYAPVGKLMNTVRQKLKAPYSKDPSSVDIHFLHDAFSEMIMKTEELEQKQRNHHHTLKNSWLKDILQGTTFLSTKDLLSKQKEYGSNVNLNEPLQLVLFRLDHYQSFLEAYNERDRALLKFAIANIISQIASTKYDNEVIELDSDKIVLLAELKEQPLEENVEEAFFKLTKTIQIAVSEYLKFSLSAAISSPIAPNELLFQSYSELYSLSLYRMMVGHGCILSPSFMNTIAQEPPTYPEGKVKLLLDCLKLGQQDKALKAYDEFFQNYSGATYENMLSSMMHLMFMIRSTFINIINNSNPRLINAIQSFSTNIELFETKDDIRESMANIFAEIVNTMDHNKQNKHNVISARVIKMIEEQYQDKNLSLRSIADELQMSSNYLGKQFKEMTDKSVSEYITNVRMFHVKHLLDSSNLSTKDILDKCGFEETNYFYTIFKKHCGMSLTEYRLSEKIK
ncbi:YesN/AraC family two-component response regulator [Paenibacillus castaneae]|uniref:AraC family transcriptional regulator n=2 Tax=Paenibacillus castaneae TaxID=474957 RepID=UPI000C9D046B|nr:helix-turn-helix domain-containing protein [Paenibacillus castaneae]NIK78741.1 YesN/AraC family two-component response regulator [Paenibacillus castaneae]